MNDNNLTQFIEAVNSEVNSKIENITKIKNEYMKEIEDLKKAFDNLEIEKDSI